MKKIIMKKLSNYGIDSKKITYIPIWTDDKKLIDFQIDRNPYREKWGIKGKFVVLYSGNMGRFHDMETIMKAAKDLNKMKEKIVFLFVGEGYKKSYVEKYIMENNLENCILKGFVEREMHPYILDLADICILSLLKGQAGLSVPSKTF